MRKLTYLWVLSIVLGITSCSDDDIPSPEILISEELEGSSYSVTQLGDNHHRVYTDIIINAPLQMFGKRLQTGIVIL